MKALITGVNGFVGTYLAEELLKKNVTVIGTKLEKEKLNKYIPESVHIVNMDLCNNKDVNKVIAEIKPDYIYHLAAQSSVALSWKNPQLTVSINVNGTLNLLEEVKKLEKNIRILIVGSSEQYGIIDPKYLPINENHVLKPNNPYAASKVAQEHLAMQYVKAYNMDIVFTRSFNHIGPRQSDIFVLSDFVKRLCEIEKGIRVPLLKVGNLEAERDFTDVRDVVNAYILLMEKGNSGEIYNVGSGKSFKIQTILDKLLEKISKTVHIERDTSRMRPSDNPVIQCDNTKLKNLGWQVKYTIEQTIDDVFNYWNNN